MKHLFLSLFFTMSTLFALAQYKLDPKVTREVDVPAEFPGGGAYAMDKFIAAHLNSPKNEQNEPIIGNLSVLFVVGKDGSIKGIQTEKPGVFEKEAKRIIGSMPKWKPAMLKGKAVDSYQEYTILFGQDSNKQDVVFKIAEQMPEFPGGVDELERFVERNIQLPRQAIDSDKYGKIRTEFVVRRDGYITDIEINKRLGYGLDEEAIRIIRLMPKWKPARVNGRAVNARYAVPVYFKKK